MSSAGAGGSIAREGGQGKGCRNLVLGLLAKVGAALLGQGRHG